MFTGLAEKQGEAGARSQSQVQLSVYRQREMSLHEENLPRGVPRYKALRSRRSESATFILSILTLKDFLIYFQSRPTEKVSKLLLATELS